MTTCTSASTPVPTPASIICGPIDSLRSGSDPVDRALTLEPLAAARRTIASALRSLLLAVWRVLPEASAPTPSDDAIATLSQSDRLGERR